MSCDFEIILYDFGMIPYPFTKMSYGSNLKITVPSRFHLFSVRVYVMLQGSDMIPMVFGKYDF